MTHRQHMSLDEQTTAVLSAHTIACPNCGHGIDPHGTDPGGICGVGDENRDRCPCLLSPNAIASLMLATAWDEGSRAGWSDRTRSFVNGARGLPDPAATPNPHRAKENR